MPLAALVMEILSAGRANVGSQAARVPESAVVVDSVAVDKAVDSVEEDKVVDLVEEDKVVDPGGDNENNNNQNSIWF
jgi:hypothetical protein